VTTNAPQMPTDHTQSRAPLTARLSEVASDYQRMLTMNPRQPEALIGMSLVALASRQTRAAVQMAEAAVDAAPAMGAAWIALGQALKTDRRGAEAETAYQRAIRLDGMDALARMGLAELKIATERPEEAIRDYELALRRQPGLVPAHLGMGHALACLGRFADALACYECALGLRPRLAEAEFAAAFALARLRQPREAIKRYRRALVERPDFAAAWMNLGCLLREEGHDIYAEAALRRAVELRPGMVAGWINLALLERARRRPDEAEKHLRAAFALNPEQVETHVAWAQYCAAERDLAGAWGWLRWALARDAKNDEAVNMQGILLHTEGRFEEAVAIFEQAEALGSLPATSNRGNSLLDLGRMDAALHAHEAAVQSDPGHPGARYNLALTQLRLGDWASGWPGYEARWSFREVHRKPRVFEQSRWNGEWLDGQRVLLHAEQGLGDTIQFCRYAALVAARGGVPVLQVQGAVERLMGSLPVVLAGQAEVARLGAKAPAFDLECPLMSLPAVIGTTPDTVPWSGAYLAADAREMGAKEKQSPAERRGDLRVGVAWAGNPKYKADRQRSMKLTTLLPLLRTSGITWISLQKGDAAQQLGALPGDVFVWDGCGSDRDLADTAAVLASLDLVITTDTCIAHLAGAMGMPVWILLPWLADWRWMQDKLTTPWYPSARLFRQTTRGDWMGVLERVMAEINGLRNRRLDLIETRLLH
jgi:tetratricopeptide (TPR) repeat protein